MAELGSSESREDKLGVEGMWTMLLLAAATPASMDETQLAYTSCLSAEADTAIRYNIEPRVFADVVGELCETETIAYRAAAVRYLVDVARDQPNFDPREARLVAEARFARVDEANRAQVVSSFGNRTRLRRGGPVAAPVETAARR